MLVIFPAVIWARSKACTGGSTKGLEYDKGNEYDEIIQTINSRDLLLVELMKKYLTRWLRR